MPVWLIKILPYGVGALALIGAVWFIHHDGYKRAEQEAVARDNERKLQNATFAILLRDKTAEQTKSMQEIINTSDAHLGDVLHSLDLQHTDTQTIITKEIARDPRFTDPAAGISDGMLSSLNTARKASTPRPCPAGSNATACFDLSPAEPSR